MSEEELRVSNNNRLHIKNTSQITADKISSRYDNIITGSTDWSENVDICVLGGWTVPIDGYSLLSEEIENIYNKGDKNMRNLYEVTIVDAVSDTIYREEKVIAKNPDYLYARLGLIEDEIERLEKGELVINVNRLMSYEKS